MYHRRTCLATICNENDIWSLKGGIRTISNFNNSINKNVFDDWCVGTQGNPIHKLMIWNWLSLRLMTHTKQKPFKNFAIHGAFINEKSKVHTYFMSKRTNLLNSWALSRGLFVEKLPQSFCRTPFLNKQNDFGVSFALHIAMIE